MLRSAVFNLYFFAIHPILFAVFLPAFLFGKRGVDFGAKAWAFCVIYGAKYIAGINFEVRGNPPTMPCVIASKHQSAWETAFFVLFTEHPIYVLKKELIYIPFFGLYLLVGKHIFINRAKGASALKSMIAQVKKRVGEGDTLIIFPEGTRTKPNAPTEIKSGIVAIYNNVDTPIIPVSLNSGEFWPRNSWRKKPGKITVAFGNELLRNLEKKEFIENLQQRMKYEG